MAQMPTKQKLFSKNIAVFECAFNMSHTFDHVILRFSIIIWTTQFVVKDFHNNVYKQLHVGYQSFPLELDGNSRHYWISRLQVIQSYSLELGPVLNIAFGWMFLFEVGVTRDGRMFFRKILNQAFEKTRGRRSCE